MNCCATPVWAEETRIHSYDADATRSASLEAVCRLFLEAAWSHAELLGVGFEQLRRQGKLWVLSRFHLSCGEMPRWGQAVTVRTWPRTSRSVFAMRDFQMLAAGGETLVTGTSAWLVIDAATRKPLRSDRMLASVTGLSDTRATERDPERLPELVGVPASVALEARYSDVDVNGHVNSGRYVGYMLDTYPAGFHVQKRPLSLEVNYLAETREKEPLFLDSLETEAGTWCHGLRKADGLEVCRARIRWGDRL